MTHVEGIAYSGASSSQSLDTWQYIAWSALMCVLCSQGRDWTKGIGFAHRLRDCYSTKLMIIVEGYSIVSKEKLQHTICTTQLISFQIKHH